ncbi:FAD-dependent oxidoreductase [Streptomyces sp. Ncost-T10-10d]|uniref:FAD-dependent oxidoreductase n=1 Tax=Streptomyces sp. Ncost-T10-10d TaxID=1839774 RepID=UPI00081E3910|nr:FAD-dependent oxidoreductase [Streptomyces sp. Ncost-T10-10d]SCF59321.1 FAD binding domain-containing protein [Streptomyces sp. Ncost-T10-10d]
MRDGRQDWDATHDVIVVGSGAGAMTGALAAAGDGLDTVVLERTKLLGGTSAYSGAAVWLPGTQVQERAGLDDSAETAGNYLRALTGDAEAERREAFLRHAPELVARLEADPAIEFEWRPFPDYVAAPGRMDAGRSFVPLELAPALLGDLLPLVRPAIDRDRLGKGHPDAPLSQGRALIGRLLLALTRTRNALVRIEHQVIGLVSEDGRITGVEVLAPHGKVRMRARRGVLLAAGGFEGDEALRAGHQVPGRAAWSMAPRGTNTGEVLEAAVAAGAATGLMDEAWWCPGTELADGSAAFTLGLRGGLAVDGSGRRFANESLPYDRMGRAIAAAGGADASFHLIFDSREGGALPAITVPPADPADHLAAGTWVRADTLPELAALIGVPAETLTETVARFNGFAADGEDIDHHRGEDPYDLFFAGTENAPGPNPCLIPLDRPPYYAARLVLSDLGTKGGLRTDVHARVLDAQGRPLPGLYAAGNTSASFTGRVYPGPGVPLGTAMVFASLAVRHMAQGSGEAG